MSELLDVTGREKTSIHRRVWIGQDWLVNITFMVQWGCVQVIFLILDLFGFVSYHDNLIFCGRFTMNTGTDVQCSHSMNLRF